MGNQLRIRTPEGIIFSYPLAGPVTRCLAVSIDFISALILANLVARVINVAGLVDRDFAQALTWIAYFVISIGYGVVLEWKWRGQTIGKKLFRLRVVDASGLRLQFHQVLLRNLLRCIDMLPAFYLIGGMVSLFNSRGQRLGDLAGGTVVIHQPRHSEPDLDQLLAGKFNSLRDYPHLAARLRQRISPDEARLLLQALVRRDEFDPDARIELFTEIAQHLRSVVAFPAEAVETIPDEQYIRNVADIVFRERTEKPDSGTWRAAVGEVE
ncbi:MAG TPA: RDD family protein [Chthoniobacteraceae bacterium]|nr:RDD family protein [Chthoniobacteraceae bacterium]